MDQARHKCNFFYCCKILWKKGDTLDCLLSSHLFWENPTRLPAMAGRTKNSTILKTDITCFRVSDTIAAIQETKYANRAFVSWWSGFQLFVFRCGMSFERPHTFTGSFHSDLGKCKSLARRGVGDKPRHIRCNKKEWTFCWCIMHHLLN